MIKAARNLFICSVALFLYACGGGGSLIESAVEILDKISPGLISLVVLGSDK